MRHLKVLWKTLLAMFIAVIPFASAQTPAEPSIVWDAQTLVLVQRGATYGRMTRLLNGSILCSFEMQGKSWVKRSVDGGRSWGQSILVRELAFGAAANPELLQLKNGRILLFYNQRPRDGIQPFAIGHCFSDDNGATWKTAPRLLYEASPKAEDGCWEPAALQLPSGEILLFFASEFPYQKNADQEITMLRSRDNGASWSKPETVAYRAGHRDGMPVPLLLQNNKGIVVAIEDNGLAPGYQLQPAIIHNADNSTWKQPVVAGNSPHRWGAVQPPLDGKIYAGAPYIRQMPTGETILSCQSREGGREREQMVVYLGDDSARNFGRASIPFPQPGNIGCYWNSLFVKNKDTITAITDTSIIGAQGVWAIDGKLARR